MTDPTLYFDDLRVGEVHEHGSYLVSREEIVEFARRYDPQAFHTDEEAAKRSSFGGLVASGWHTASIAMRLFVESFVGRAASRGSPGVDELRWLLPVRPGDTLTLKTEVVALTPSRKKPDRGTIRVRYELTNQRGELVMTMIGIGILMRRAA